jgi:hypothetical protein
MLKATQAFRNGYWHATTNQPRMYVNDGTFGGYDYTEGYDYGLNMQYWDAVNENKSRDQEARRSHDPR